MSEKVHLLLLDLLKVMALLAIQIFHTWEFIFFQDLQIHTATSWIFWTFSWYARALAIGGQILVSVVYLLFGLNGKDRKYFAKIIPFALLGQVFITLSFMESGFFLENLEWDIYTFVAATNILLILSPHPARWKLAVSTLLFLIPPQWWKEISPSWAIFDILTGKKSGATSGSWPMLPWFFLVYSFYNLGGLVRQGKLDLRNWFPHEKILWGVLFLVAIPAWGFYIMTPVGPNYYFHIFHQDTYTFLANFLPSLFVIRLSFLDSVRVWTEKKQFFQWISSLMWARKVGVSYMVAVIIVGLAARFDHIFRTVPFALDIFFVSLMPATEIIVRFIYRFRSRSA